MRHGSLFSGIGGFDLAAEWMGWENVFHCEWNEFGKRVLQHYWPNAISYGDITKTDFTKHRGTIDILTGGFPCQPFSHAGKRKSKQDSRYLWPEYLRAIQEIDPKFIVAENVANIDGMALKQVLNDMENEGYEAIPPLEIEASSVGAFHRRNRVWIIAIKENAFNTNTNSLGLHRKKINFKRDFKFRHKQNCLFRSLVSKGIREGTDSTIFGPFDGLSSQLDGITLPKWRKESIKAAGNAIVPQVAYEIFQAIEKFDELKGENNE